MTSGQVERAYPFGLGILATILAGVLMYKVHVSVGDSVKDLFASAINVGAIATGFLGTMQSILLTSERRRLVGYLKDAGKLTALIDYLLGAISLCIAVAVCSGVILFFAHHRSEGWFQYVLSAWFGLAIWTASSCYRAFSIMSVILKSSD